MSINIVEILKRQPSGLARYTSHPPRTKPNLMTERFCSLHSHAYMIERLMRDFKFGFNLGMVAT